MQMVNLLNLVYAIQNQKSRRSDGAALPFCLTYVFAICILALTATLVDSARELF